MTFKVLVENIYTLISTGISVLIGIGLVIFLWGMVLYVYRAGSLKAQNSGKDIMTWGLLTLFVMVSVWGIISLAQTAFFEL